MKEQKQKHVGRRLLSLLMAFALVITSLAVSPVTAKAANNSVDIKIHFKNYDSWSEVAAKATEGESWTSIAGAKSYNSWPGVKLEEETEHSGYYTLSINNKNADSQFNCIFNNNVVESGKQTSNIIIPADTLASSDGSLEYWCISKDGALLSEAPNSWTTGGTDEKECVLTINFKSTLGNDVASYLYSGEEKPAGAWPGAKMSATEGHDGWYTAHLIVDNSKDYNCILNNNGNGEQLKDFSVETTGKTDAEYWYDGTTLSTELPEDWKYTTTIHYLAPSSMGDKISVYAFDGTSTLTGPGYGKSWPGEEITANAEHKGWYDAVYTQDNKNGFKCIFNNGDTTSMVQTSNIPVDVTSTSTELWVVEMSDTVYKQAPDTWEAPPEPYSFTMYYYNPDLTAEDIDKIDLWMWNAGLNGSYVFTDTEYDAENEVTWFKQTITVTNDKIGDTVGLKARYDRTSGDSGWAGGSDLSNRFFKIDGGENEVLYYVDGQDPVHQKPALTAEEKRYFYLEYENPTLAAGVTPQFYSWTTGYKAERIDFEANGTGKWIVKVPVKPTCAKVDFVVALDASCDPWVKDGGDHSISFPLDQNVVCASIKTGEEPKLSAPYNIGYELQPKEDQISFYYRDDKALVEGNLADLQVAVEINGTEQSMTYSESNKRFEYVSKGLQNGRIDYRYKVGSEYVLDKYNPNQEVKKEVTYSYVDYYKLNATISAEVMKPSFNYNENNVVKFKVNQAETDKQKLEVASASIDVSSLGGSSALAIQPELQAVTISATRETPLGTKTLPIVVTDQYGNEYHTTVDVNVVARTKTTADDFDWDEAVIYFMVTDRFFDGNENNNTASNTVKDNETVNTFDKKNPGMYHGGDFAGLTQKLDYLDELGINTVWITPIVENIPGVKVTGTGSADVPYNAAFHGYWASDFTKLNPTLGTEEEFKTLISEAHKRGIKIMVDIVVNHAGYGTEEKFGNMIRSGSDIVSGDDQKDSLSNLPDFKTEDPAVSAQLVKWQTQWVKDYGIDYFRVDTVKHVENATWAELKNSLTEADPKFKMIGEYAGGGYAGNGGTLGTGEMDSDLDFDFNDQATSFVSGNISSVESFLTSRNAALNNTYMTGQFLGSHDEIGFKQNLITNKKMTEDAATAASLVAATLQITAKGQPVIYYGEEIGLTGENNYPYQTNRYDFDWSKVNDDNVTYQHYKKMLAIRNAYTDVFARGDRKSVAVSDEKGYDVVSRSYGGTKLYVGMNIKSAEQTVDIPVSESNGSVMTDLYSGKTYTVSNGKVSVAIPAAAVGGTVVLKKTGETSTGGSTGGGSYNPTQPTEPTKPTEPTTPTEPTEPSKPDNTTVTQNPDGTTTETKTETVKNDAGKEVSVTVTTDKDTSGNVTGSKEVSVIADADKNTSVTVTVQKDAAGSITSAKAVVTAKGTGSEKSITGKISGDVVSQISEAAGAKDVSISVKVSNGKKSYTVKADADELTAGAKLKVVAIDKKTKKYVLVNAKTYTVNKAGDVKVALASGSTYELVTPKEAAKIEKTILNTVKTAKSSASVKKGKTTTVKLSSKLDMNNVSKIEYVSSKNAIATVSKTGKVKAKKKGTVTVKVKVTLKNGKTKTVTTKIKVK